MVFWVTFLFWLGTSIVTALLTKPKIENARPSGLDDFQVPTATEGRVVPVIVGKVKMAGPNVVWYGDLQTQAIKEKVGGFLGIGAKNVTKAYKYFIGVQMAVCRGPIDGHDRIWFGDKIIKTGESAADFAFDDPEFFGGEERGGGATFTLKFFNGDASQPVDTYLATQYQPTPAYVNTCYFILNDGSSAGGLIGQQATLKNLAFELFWYPNSLGVTGGKERIGDDANPICFLFELLVTNTDWGIQFDPADILLTGTAEEGNFIAVAEQCFDEGLAFSMVIDGETEIRSIIQEVERHVDGAFLLDLTDGLYKIVLARPAIATPPTLDESNIVEMVNFARGNWSNTNNEVRVGYADRAKEYGSTFSLDQDLGNRQIVGRRNPTQLNFPGCKTAVLANQLASRELRGLSFPIAKVTLRTTRDQYALQRGRPFLFTWPDEGIVTLPMRVIKIRYGTDTDGEITIDAVEDIYQLEQGGFADPPPTGWLPPAFDAVNLLDARLWQPPAQLATPVLPNQFGGAANGVAPVMLAARNGGLHLDYDIYTDFDGTGIGPLDIFELSNANVTGFNPVALLLGPVSRDLDGPPDYVDTIVIDAISDVTGLQLTVIANDTVSRDDPTNVILVDDELMWFEGATDNLNGTVDLTTVHRGAFGTIPQDHADNARVWFPTQGGELVQPISSEREYGGQIRCKVTPRTATGAITLASADLIPLVGNFSLQSEKPYAPGDAVLNTEKFVDGDWTRTPGTARLSWNNRSRAGFAFDTKQDDPPVDLAAITGIVVEIKRVDTSAVVASADFALLGEFNRGGFIPNTTPGIPDELDFFVEIKATIRFGPSSQLWVTQNFEVFGFGIDFGGDFGGQAEAADTNFGLVGNQGAAPIVPEVVSGTGIPRAWTIDFLGPLATPMGQVEGRELIFTMQSTVDGQSFGANIFLADDQPGQDTLEGMAEVVRGALEAGAGTAVGGPFTFTRTGTQVQMETNFGDLNFRQRKGGSIGVPLNRLPGIFITQAAAPPETPIQQIVHVDFFKADGLAPTINPDILSPANAPEFAIGGGSFNQQTRMELIVRALTFDQQQGVVGLIGGGTGTAGFGGFGVVPSGLSDSYSQLFPEFYTKVQESDFTANFLSSVEGPLAFRTGLDKPMSRPSIVLTISDNFEMPEQYALNRQAQKLSPQYPPYSYIVKELSPAVPGDPTGLQQVNGSGAVNGGDTVGSHIFATLDGTVFDSGPSGGNHRLQWIAVLDAVDLDSRFSVVNRFDESHRGSMGATIVDSRRNTPYEVYMDTSFGLRIQFRDVSP